MKKAIKYEDHVKVIKGKINKKSKIKFKKPCKKITPSCIARRLGD